MPLVLKRPNMRCRKKDRRTRRTTEQMCELVEIFDVRYIGGDGAHPSGQIKVYDGKRGQIIYRRHKPSTCSAQNGNKVVKLPLTGPYRAISSNGCVTIELDLHHGCQYRESSYMTEILIDIYDDSIEYDLAVMKEVNTCSCPHSPRAEIKYAILSDTVETVVEMKLRQRGCYYVKGKIVALTDLGEVVLFESNDENKLIEPTQGLTAIPLSRSVLAVALKFLLTIKVHLHVCSSCEIVEYVQWEPNLDSERQPVNQDGVVEVEITCSN